MGFITNVILAIAVLCVVENNADILPILGPNGECSCNSNLVDINLLDLVCVEVGGSRVAYKNNCEYMCENFRRMREEEGGDLLIKLDDCNYGTNPTTGEVCLIPE